jgi:hypothetical protein
VGRLAAALKRRGWAMREVIGMLFGVLLTIAAIMIGSVMATVTWQQETDVLEPIRSVGIEEYRRGERAPVLNPGKPILSCAECANYTLTDYRRSPTVFGPNGLYKGHFEGDEFIFDTPPTIENLFSRRPPPRRGRGQGW